MEHSEALEREMVERYLLGDLLPEDQDAFEEHYFDCTECSDAVRAGVVLLESGRMVAGENERTKVVPMPRRRQSWLQVAAVAAFAVFGLENLALVPIVPRMLRQARNATHGTVPTSVGTLSASRGGQSFTSAPNQPLQLDIDIPSPTKYPSYTCTVRGAQGGAGEPVKFTAAQARDVVPVVYPAGVPAGIYEVAVEGLPQEGKPVAIATYRLDVR